MTWSDDQFENFDVLASMACILNIRFISTMSTSLFNLDPGSQCQEEGTGPCYSSGEEGTF